MGSLGIGSRVGTRALDIKDGELDATGGEIKQLWHGLDDTKISKQIQLGLKLLLLTGVRSGELRLATWDQINFDKKTWTIPGENIKHSAQSKTKARDFTVPLTDTALALFKDLKADGFKYIIGFDDPLTGEGSPLSDRALSKALRRQFYPRVTTTPPPLTFEPCTPHDLRRTVRTHLSSLNIPPHIAEKCLNHSLGHIEQTYNKYSYLDERREALELWDRRIQELISAVRSEALT